MYNNINWREQDPDFYVGSESDDNYTYPENDEGIGESIGENDENVLRRGMPPFLGGVRGRPFSAARPRPFQGAGTINTPAGTANVSLPQNLATKAELQALEQKVLANNKAILANGQAINRTNQNVKQMDTDLRRRIADNAKNIANVQQAQMFSALLPPKLEELTVGTNTSTVTDAKFNMTSALLPALLTGGLGGSGSGASSGSTDMMLPIMLIAASGGLGGGSSSGDNSTMILALALMMGNKK